MGFLNTLGAASALISLVSAVPLDLEKRGVAFRLDQTVQKPFILSGPALMAKTYAKYGKAIPPVIAAAAANNDGTVTATPEEYDAEYLCPVSIGGQTLNLDFDTGSSDLWVFSTELPASEQSGHTLYNPAKSTTSKVDSGETWDISYGDGSGASGNVYFDTVKVGATTVTSQAVEAAESVSAEFESDTASDGLLGLAFDSINTASPNQVATFFENAIPTLAAPLFTANLKKGEPGNYNFGYIDSTEYTGSITYVAVNTANGFWEFTGNGYAVGSGSFVSSSIDAIADTGTTLLYLPAAAVKAYYAKVSGATNSASQGGYIFPCSATLPSITLGIGSYKAVVPGTYLNYAPATGSQCFGGIQSNAGIGFSIYGDIFLKSQFVVFNGASTPELGFAPKAT
ncbi:MAG: Type I transmembrane sorting receptor [Alectoria fallacina]|uniref:Type I transmembrane sorting receptor n=1 Tax=Alectoria fallacina TaxID=1903189 RepID=A0A8H3F8E5_9LECA|nr:MAG: Type I transmembrane sorting receptor [Alectoria fallacina]